MKNQIAYFLIFLFCLVNGYLLGQTYVLEVNSIEDGLSQSTINAITQDSKGFIWLGTQDGLNRFDGRKFTVFKKNPFDSTSLADNYITSLLADHHDHLWIGSKSEGLSATFPGEDEFLHLKYKEHDPTSLSSNQVVKIYQTSDKHIWVATSNGFNKLRYRRQKDGIMQIYFERFLHSNTTSRLIPSENHISSIYLDSKGYFWVGSHNGIYRYKYGRNGQLSEQIQFLYAKPDKKHRYHHSINAICEDKQGNIWMGTNYGLFIFNPFTESIQSYKDPMNGENWNKGVLDIIKSSNGDIFIATTRGLYLLETKMTTQQIVPFPYQVKDKKNVQTQSITCLMEDRMHKGLVWLGTSFSGLIKMHELRKNFKTNHFKESPFYSSIHPSVRFIEEDKDNRLWVGVENGILVCDPVNKNHELLQTISSGKEKIHHSLIIDLFQDKKGNLWAGSWRGPLQLKENGQGEIAALNFWEDYDCKDMGVYDFYEDEDFYYLATNTGVSFLEKHTLKLSPCSIVIDSVQSKKSTYKIIKFLKDSRNNFWIGTSNGLILFRNLTGNLKQDLQKPPEIYYHNNEDMNGLVDNFINDIVEDGEGNIWLGTMNGLVRATIKEDKGLEFENFGEEDGLTNHVVYGILLDDASGELWISTNNGLSRFNHYNRRFTNYNTKDGLQSNEFNARAYHKSPRGEFYFGGVKGLTSFFPNEIQLEKHIPPVWLLQLQTSNNQTYNLIQRHSSVPLSLPYIENSFTVLLNGIDHLHPDDLLYFYDLEGANKKDIPLGNQQRISFNNLQPGHYTLRVKAMSKDGVKNIIGDSLQITILPPYWKNAWFFAALAALLVFIIGLTYHFSYQWKMKRIAEIEQVRKSAAEDFHDELGSKLSIISMYSELTKKQLNGTDKEVSPYLNKVINTSNSLYESMKDVIWAINPEQDSINDLFLQLKDFGEDLYSHSGIAFNSTGVAEAWSKIKLPMKYKRHILLIFKESMHNSLRHAQCKTVYLNVSIKDNNLNLELIDDGVGFNPEEDFLGEGIKNMKNRSKKIDSDLLVQSDAQGTVVKLICDLI